jgi:hypothetical protein
MAKVIKGEVKLRNRDIERLQKALGIIPPNLNGEPYVAKVRRGEIERRRLSLVKHDIPAPNQCEESQELYKLCRWAKGKFNLIGWALRSRVSGDYYIYAETW